MSEANKQLARALRVRFGTTQDEPNETQLEKIKGEIDALRTLRGRVSEDDWRRVVTRHCPSAGNGMYKGIDNSDLIALLNAAIHSK